MDPLQSTTITFLTITVGLTSVFIAVVLALCSESGIKSLAKIFGPSVNYGFTASPLLFMLYNCVAITYAEMVTPDKVVDLGVTYGVNPVILAYSVAATIYYVSSETITTVHAAMNGIEPK